MQLPEIHVGGEPFVDCSQLVHSFPNARPGTIGLGIHHSVGQTEFPDLNFNGTTEDEEQAHIVAIDGYHVGQGYGGFGYQGIAFPSGRVYVCGTGGDQRAGIAYRNHEIESICMAGTFTDAKPGLGVQLGVARWVKAKWAQRGTIPVKGHTQWADPRSPSSCPGQGGLNVIPNILVATQALIDGDTERMNTRVRNVIRAALAPAYEKGDLETMAKQIAWITGGKLCK